MWLKVRLSSLSLFRMHGSGKLVKYDGGKSDNSHKSNFLLLCCLRTRTGLNFGL